MPIYKVTEYIFENLRKYFPEISNEVSTEKELLDLPWVKFYTKHPKYSRFSISVKSDCKYLMIENEDRSWWWIVATIPKELPTSLPSFVGIKVY